MSVSSVLVTGGSRGIGLAFVRHFLGLQKPPKHVIATCRDPGKAHELKELASAHPNLKVIKLDLQDESTISSAGQEVAAVLGDVGLNLLINNAGILHKDVLDSITSDAMKESFQVNTLGPLLMTKAVLPLLKKAASSSSIQGMSINKAAIVNITSQMGSVDDNTSGRMYAYRCSKAALNMLTHSFAVDLKADGILAVVMHPGFVITDMTVGAPAKITAKESTDGMMKVMNSLTEESTGKYYTYAGKELPW